MEEWDQWAEKVKGCSKCGLCKPIKVLGVGPAPCDLVFVGESPGEYEEKLGKPFVGKAGKLLTKLLTKVSINREDIYISNIVKCRPPNNQTTTESSQICREWLYEEIKIVKPKVIVLMGAFAADGFIKDCSGINSVRGNWHYFGCEENLINILPIYHPAHVLYGGGDGAEDKIVLDLIKVREFLWGVGVKGNPIKSVKIKSKLLGDELLVGENGISLAELWLNLKGEVK